MAEEQVLHVPALTGCDEPLRDTGRALGPSLLEGALAVWANNLLVDEGGNPTNARYAEEWAAMFIRRYCTGVEPEPPMESWEVEFAA